MIQVDFYILADPSPDARHRLACRLAEKAYQRGQRTYIHTDSPSEATLMDDLLWTFRAGSFLPHGLYPSTPEPYPPILIGYGEGPGSHVEVLINLARAVPPFFERFARVAEPVDQNETIKQDARTRYRLYRERGCALKSHNLSAQVLHD